MTSRDLPEQNVRQLRVVDFSLAVLHILKMTGRRKNSKGVLAIVAKQIESVSVSIMMIRGIASLPATADGRWCSRVRIQL